MVINEIFYSLQGEGLLAGVPSVFIRLAGCPLHCTWCDTKYAWDPNAGDDLTIPQIIQNVNDIASSLSFSPHSCGGGRPPSADERRATSHESRFVVITGGEPMVNEQLPELASALKEQGKHVTIETAGVAFVEGLACDLLSISPKTSNSGTKSASNPNIIRRLISRYPYQLKFVVDSPNDLPEIQQLVQSLGDFDLTKVMLMPQANTRDDLIAKSPMVAELCKKTGFSFCNRLQILLYDGSRGK